MDILGHSHTYYFNSHCGRPMVDGRVRKPSEMGIEEISTEEEVSKYSSKRRTNWRPGLYRLFPCMNRFMA